MKKLFAVFAAVGLFTVGAYAQAFTDLAGNAKYEGKTGLKKLATAIDANFALIESGATINASVNNLTGDGALTWIGGGVTSRFDDASGKIDGEQIANDTIDDDSIDFADVTGADLTLTDCGAISGTTLAASGAATLSGSVTVIGSSTTSRWDNASSKIDGEQIADDTIDDDSIDFADVTGADLTLTDCGAITSSGAVQGTTLALSATQWFAIVDTTQLVFIAGGATNVLDSDITAP